MTELRDKTWPKGADWPTVAASDAREAGLIQLALAVEEDCPWVQGHFPDNPVIPGVVLLHWAIGLARCAWPELGDMQGVTRLKFQRPIQPPAQISLQLQRHGADAVQFTFHNREAVCAGGRVHVA